MLRVESDWNDSLLKMYNAACKSKWTSQSYTYLLKKYADNDLQSLLSLNQTEAEDKLINFIITNKENGMHWGSLHNYVAAVAKFYKINKIKLDLDRVKQFLPEQTILKKDRAYETPDIQKLLNLSTERLKALILLLCSSGPRLGALAAAKFSDLQDRGDIYKITYYPNTLQEYWSYCSPEARIALDTYFEIRRRHGEVIVANAPIIREQYNVENPIAIRYPKHCTVGALAKVINQVTTRAGLRSRMPKTETKTIFNKDIQLSRGFRKFFNTQLNDADINYQIKEMLMGHDIGLDSSYLRHNESKIEQEYRKAIDLLTIDPSNRLQKKITEMEQAQDKFDKVLTRIDDLEKQLGIA